VSSGVSIDTGRRRRNPPTSPIRYVLSVLSVTAIGCASPSSSLPSSPSPSPSPSPSLSPSPSPSPPAPTAEAVDPATSGLALAALFADNMVLQRGVDVPVWGVAAPGEQIKVVFRGQSVAAVADGQGQWTARLAPLEAGGPFEFTVAGRRTVTLENVMVGEVWIASGQSNMSFRLSQSSGAPKDVDEANFPQIRLFTVNRDVADRPQTRHGGRWEVCSPEAARNFSAVAYHFGREIHDKLGVPIGLIHSSWSGSPIEAWMSKEALASDPSFKSIYGAWAKKVAENREAIEKYENEWLAWRARADEAITRREPFAQQPDGPEGPRHQYYPSNLYNAMLAPLAPYAARGFLWYQGEGNRRRPAQYGALFPVMIGEVRRIFGQPELPFLFVQLATYGKTPKEPEESTTAELREAQLMTLAVPKTGMAVTIDIGDPKDVHPKNKKDVGHRLALAARSVAYGEDLVFSGPIYESMKVEGSTIRVSFKHAEGGLEVKPGEKLDCFSIAGADRRFRWADAAIDGATVLVSRKGLKKPSAVRFAWAESPTCTLFNKLGLPASPFRTDAPRSGRAGDAAVHR
jgi:sialate O-acetylesterase